MTVKHCVFEYLYRDAGNFKIWGSVLLRGAMHTDDRRVVESNLEGGELFIPEQVGLKSLQRAFESTSAVPAVDDHVWHEFVELRPATKADLENISERGDKAELLVNFCRVETWDESLSPIYSSLTMKRPAIGRARYEKLQI